MIFEIIFSISLESMLKSDKFSSNFCKIDLSFILGILIFVSISFVNLIFSKKELISSLNKSRIISIGIHA
jgi:hypothetical protein